MAKVGEQAARKEAEKAEKLKRAEARTARKDTVQALEQEWRMLKENHEARVTEWDTVCERLKGGEVAKKDWPKKPLRPRKPKIPTDLEYNDEGNEEEEGDGDQ